MEMKSYRRILEKDISKESKKEAQVRYFSLKINAGMQKVEV